jgi:hypothetical protein
MIANDAIQSFTAGTENRVPHHGSIVGVGLVPALVVYDVLIVGATTRVAPTLGDVIGAYKSFNRICQYILDNPRYWYKDRYNPNVRKGNE